jgi:hypothetical protein
MQCAQSDDEYRHASLRSNPLISNRRTDAAAKPFMHQSGANGRHPPRAAVAVAAHPNRRNRPKAVLQSSSALSKGKCQILPWTTDEACDLEASIVRPQDAKHLRAVPYLKAVG